MIDVRQLKGSNVQGWLLTDILGEGADGIVYVGNRGEKVAAIKIFFPDVLDKNGRDEALERLDLQLSLRGEKQHPNLVEILEGGVAPELDDTLFLVMEHVHGKSLDKIIESIPRLAIPSLICQLADAARFLDTHDLVHRDIKPANIVVSYDFSCLTLLDLGIILNAGAGDDDRLSGQEFVATLRYSPPEFVWRKEISSSNDAWRAITFYQIGASLHDMLMRKPLFDGYDRPRANLYDAVRLRSPEIAGDESEKWLVELAKCCLVKNWQERLQLVTWDSFYAPNEIDDGLSHQQKMIKLRQIRGEEGRFAAEAEKKEHRNKRISELWNLQNQVFMEIRQFLIKSRIFPKFSGTHSQVSEKQYSLKFEFEEDSSLMFNKKLVAEVGFSIDGDHELATKLKVTSVFSTGETIFTAAWTEMFEVESAAALIRQSLLQVADQVVPQN